MLYLEERQIVHRDLAAGNCLIGENENLQVTDVGLTQFVRFDHTPMIKSGTLFIF